MRNFARYTRRMLGVSSRRFAREENGAVMVMSIIFALPLAYFMFITYNTGIALTTRLRAQNCADAASYTASLWQARFYNFCAYSRRQILGNYATMALCTSYESCLKLYIKIYDAQGLEPNFLMFGDSGIIKDTMEPFYQILGATFIRDGDEYNESDTTNPIRITRHGADAMNYMLSNAQLAMYLSLANGNKIMKKVVDEADRRAAVGGTGLEFELLGGDGIPVPLVPFRSYSSVVANFSGTALIESKAVTKNEVKYYCDNFTLANVLGGFSPLPFLGRGPIAGMTGVSPPPSCNTWDPRIVLITTYSIGCDINNAGSKMNSKDGCFGQYIWGTLCIGPIYAPIGPPILGPSMIMGGEEESDYSVKHNFNATKVYSVKSGVSSENLEPTSWAIVEAKNDMHAFFMQDKGMGHDISPNTLDQGNHIRAYSRAKVYFRGPLENLSGAYRYDKPNLNYARWGAKLASIEGHSAIKPFFHNPLKGIWY